ncbi:uncharacterized protein LOC130613087 [Hydractinia symbiolongicarpus]|uniref:uncharacterized protein LOC130613087 n=1 Tax=Hydractinia symbiolongicarpus TaxID=13093 RepID=UPI00254C8405|nr:uncharacterized protein LOC130613087 [Hydractinia symbiolongicarpus]
MAMKFILAAVALMAGAQADLHTNTVTGTTPPPVPCPNSLCAGKADGNHYYDHPTMGQKDNYFVQCVSGLAYCQACWPLSLKFKKECNQCLYSMNGKHYIPFFV